MISRAFVNIIVEDLAASRAFYELLGLRVRFDSEWFVHLGAADNELLELGLLRRGHSAVHASVIAEPDGIVLTLVIDDVDEMFRQLTEADAEIVEPPHDMFYGQRRLLVRGPAGELVDLSSECEPDPAWLSRVTQREDGAYIETPEN